MIINTIVITNRVRAMAEDAGLTVQLCDERIAATSGTVIYLERPKYNWTPEQMTIWEAGDYHEIGHCSPANKDIFKIIKEKKIHMKSRLGLCLNVLDDLRQEKEQFGRYAGRDRVMGEGNYLVMRNHIKDKTFDYEGPVDDGKTLIASCMGYMTHVFEWYPEMSGMTERIRKALPKPAAEMMDKLIEHDAEINPLGCDGKGVYERALRLLELFGLDPEQEEKDAQDKTKSEEQLSKDAEEFKKEVLKHMHSDRDIDEHSEEGGKPTLAARGDREKEESDKSPEADVKIEPDYDDYVPSNWKDMELLDYAKSPCLTEGDSVSRKMTDQGMFLGTHVRKLLQTMSQTRQLHGLKRGKLSSKSLYRATMTKTGEYQKKVFKKKEDTISLDVAVQLVVDGSGSMRSQSKYQAATASAVIMSSVLTSLRIKHEIIVFTEMTDTARGAYLKHGIIKSFAKSASTEQLLSNFKGFQDTGMHNNLDGESIIWSAMRLAQQVSKRKLLIVFSDGMPAAHRRGAAQITKDAIKEIEGRRDMEIYGIGIMADSVENYYTEYKVIMKIGQLEAALLQVIKSKIINR